MAKTKVDNRQVSNPHFFRVGPSSTQNIDDATQVRLDFDTVYANPDGNYDNTTNYRYTAAVAGYYHCGANIRYTHLDDGDLIYVYIRKNGTQASAAVMQMSGTAESGVAVSDIVYLEVGDYVDFATYQSSGGQEIVRSGVTWVWAYGVLVHAT